MPFITEEIWQKLPVEGESIMVASFPQFHQNYEDKKAEITINLIMDIVTSVRNIRGEMNINPGQKLELLIETKDATLQDLINDNIHYIKDLAKAASVSVSDSQIRPEISSSVILNKIDLIVPLEGIIDFEQEKKRIEKELKKIEKDLIVLNKKLSNPNFAKKAPPEVIRKDRGRQTSLKEKQFKLLVHLKTFKERVS